MGQSPASKHAEGLRRETRGCAIYSGMPITERCRKLGPHSQRVNEA